MARGLQRRSFRSKYYNVNLVLDGDFLAPACQVASGVRRRLEGSLLMLVLACENA